MIIKVNNEGEFKEWLFKGESILRKQNDSFWELGDWINEGKSKFGSKYRLALEMLKSYRYQSLVNIAYVCARIPIERRRWPTLYFTHYTEVASLSVKEQEHWLSLASENNWTVSAMRRVMRQRAELACEREEGSDAFNIVRWCKEGVRWFEREYASIRRDAQRRAALKQDLRPLVDIYNKL